MDKVRSIAKHAAPVLFAGVMFITASPRMQETMLAGWAGATAAAVGWYIIAKYNYLRWLAGTPQREAESRARRQAILEEWDRPKPEQQTADWFNWDGPHTVAGQRR